MPSEGHAADLYADVEERLRPLAEPLPAPQAGDWLAEHPERGQTFEQYWSELPVRRGADLNGIYLCYLGDFSEREADVLEWTRDYLGAFFDVPVRVRRRVPLADIPRKATRTHPAWGDAQVLSTYVLRDVLGCDRPDDALAYLALTAADLWPGKGWNFVYGQANLRQRVGVWSIYRNGDPDEDEAAFRLCLRRTLATAAHETGHILTMRHCTAHLCLMNGSNHQQERDSRPLYPCPVCLRKLCWNLGVEPAPYLGRLAAFCRGAGMDSDADWYSRAASLLASRGRQPPEGEPCPPS